MSMFTNQTPKNTTSVDRFAKPETITTAPRSCAVRLLGVLLQSTSDGKTFEVKTPKFVETVYAVEITDAETKEVITRAYTQTSGGALCKLTEKAVMGVYYAWHEHMGLEFAPIVGHYNEKFLKEGGKAPVELAEVLADMATEDMKVDTKFVYTKTCQKGKETDAETTVVVNLDFNTRASNKAKADRLLASIK